MTALIIEDDVQWAHVLAAVLSMADAPTEQILIAHTFREGWARVVEQPWDVVFLDLTLPDSSRQQTVESMVQMKAIGVKRIAVVTGEHVTNAVGAELAAAGADDCVSKNCVTLQQCLVDVISGKSVAGAC